MLFFVCCILLFSKNNHICKRENKLYSLTYLCMYSKNGSIFQFSKTFIITYILTANFTDKAKKRLIFEPIQNKKKLMTKIANFCQLGITFILQSFEKWKNITFKHYWFHTKTNLTSYAPDKNPTTGVMLLLARAQVGILHFNSEWPKNWLVQEKCSAKVFFVQFDWKKIIAGENSWLFIMHFLSLTHFHIIIFRRYRDLSYCEIYTQH